MPTILKERSAIKDVLIQSGGDTQADADVDLGGSYEEIILTVTAAEAANLASGTISILVNDKEVHDELGDLMTIAKPAAGQGIHLRVYVGAARLINVVASVTPSSDFTAQVQGVGRLVIDEAQREFAKVWTI